MGSNPQLLKGVIEFCVLKIISQKPTYGYEILSQLKKYWLFKFYRKHIVSVALSFRTTQSRDC